LFLGLVKIRRDKNFELVATFSLVEFSVLSVIPNGQISLLPSTLKGCSFPDSMGTLPACSG
jgi:hypothetical protein